MMRLRHIACCAALGLAGTGCRTSTEPTEGPGSVVWTASGASLAAPALADSTVYFGTSDHAAVALDRRTGVVRWRTPTGESGGLSPGRNVLVVGPLLIVPDFGVYGFDRATGQRRWSFRPASGDTPGRYTLATDGTRVFMGSAAGFVYAIDASTGASIWTNPLAFDGNSVASYPVWDRGVVYVTLRHFTNPSTGGVVALDAASGAVLWEHDFVATGPGRGAGSYGRVGIWHDLVIAAAEDGTVYALHRDGGGVAWISPRPAEEGGYGDQRPVAVVGDVVAVGSDLLMLMGLDAATGRERWRIGSRHGSVNFEMGTDGRYLYLPYTGLQVSQIDPLGGSIVWTSPSAATGDYAAFPVADAERVYVPGWHGLYALRR